MWSYLKALSMLPILAVVGVSDAPWAYASYLRGYKIHWDKTATEFTVAGATTPTERGGLRVTRGTRICRCRRGS